MAASLGGMYPTHVMGTAMKRDGCPNAREACTAPGDADSHGAPWGVPMRAKDGPIHRSRTPMGSHGKRQAGTRTEHSARSRMPMRSYECQKAATRKNHFASCGHPWGPHGREEITGRMHPFAHPRPPKGLHRRAHRGRGRGDHDEGLSRRGLRCPHRTARPDPSRRQGRAWRE